MAIPIAWLIVIFSLVVIFEAMGPWEKMQKCAYKIVEIIPALCFILVIFWAFFTAIRSLM